MQNLLQSKKMFHDWLDRNRPWAQPENKNVYRMMEQIVNAAVKCFADERFASVEEAQNQVETLEHHLHDITAQLPDHPEGYEGPCCCMTCVSYGDQ